MQLNACQRSRNVNQVYPLLHHPLLCHMKKRLILIAILMVLTMNLMKKASHKLTISTLVREWELLWISKTSNKCFSVVLAAVVPAPPPGRVEKQPKKIWSMKTMTHWWTMMISNLLRTIMAFLIVEGRHLHQPKYRINRWSKISMIKNWSLFLKLKTVKTNCSRTEKRITKNWPKMQ